MTAEEILKKWQQQGREGVAHEERQLPGMLRCRRKAQALYKLARKDADAFLPTSKITKNHVPAFKKLIELGKQAKPVPVATSVEVPKAPARLLDAAYHRLNATKSVAASELGTEHELTKALGFKTDVEKTPSALHAALTSQKLVLQQKDENGKDLPHAAQKRKLLEENGLSQEYLTLRVQPEIDALAPFLPKEPNAVRPTTFSEWQWAVIVASHQFLVAAELSFDAARVKKYRNAQPRSQAGRFGARRKAKAATPQDGTTTTKAKRGKKKAQVPADPKTTTPIPPGPVASGPATPGPTSTPPTDPAFHGITPAPARNTTETQE